ncbi:MAG: thiamine pyrophosphate-binding protein [SAR202 cluster bacterium]|jgi:acetolactate synthase-1/2/3 large subunit|nr:thiamine pyrophosphate-binding protein [SAR202 cluster bacterium]
MGKVDGSELVAQAIAKEGIDTLFGLPGGPIVEIMGYAPHHGVRPIGVRHEQAAAFAATAWGYVSNKVGVCVMAAGPGVTNGVTGAHVAFDNCLPLVLLGGSGHQGGRYSGTFQETENVPMYASITKMAVQVDSAARVPHYMAMAFRKAKGGRPGPVYLDLPSDVLQEQVDEDQVVWPSGSFADSPPMGSSERVKEAAELLLNAERPAMIVGKGVRWSEPTAELAQLVDSLGMPFLTSPMGRGFIPDDHPKNFGSARSTLMREADVILVVGARLNWMFDFGRRFAPDAKIIHIDIEPEEIGINRPIDVGIVGDAKATLQQILAEIEGKTEGMADRAEEGPWISALQEKADTNAESLEPLLHSDESPIRTYRLLNEVQNVFPRETVYSVDGQTTLASGRQVLPSHTPASRLNAGSNGCIGVGVPFAVGAKLARPDVPVVSVSGDCAFGFNAMELETAVRHNLPIVFIVNNNSGIVGGNLESRMGLPEGYDERVAQYTPDIRYDKFVEAFGGHAENVTDPNEIRPALERAYAATQEGRVACVNIISESMEQVVTRSNRASELMGY